MVEMHQGSIVAYDQVLVSKHLHSRNICFVSTLAGMSSIAGTFSSSTLTGSSCPLGGGGEGGLRGFPGHGEGQSPAVSLRWFLDRVAQFCGLGTTNTSDMGYRYSIIV